MCRARFLVVVSLVIPLVLIPFGLSGCLPSTEDVTGVATARSLFTVAPTVALTADVVRGIRPLTVRFSSAGSTDDGLIVSRAWDFGDGGTSADISPMHTFISTGEFTVTLTLTDDDGVSASDTVVISVTEAPVAVIGVDRTTAESAPAQFEFDASSSYDPDGTITAYRWVFGDGSVEFLPITVHTFATAGTFRVRLTVTDNTGVTASATKIIQVGIPQPKIEFRVPPPNLQNVVVSPESPLWVYVFYEVEPGVPRTITAGLQPTGGAVGDSIRLDTDPPNGNDLNLTVPAALDLSVLTDAQVPGQYYLWAELDTDLTQPVRTYARPRINVVRSFTSTVDVSTTPRIPLVNDQAVVVMAPMPTRQVFDLGPLSVGDRLHLSLASMPGYGEFYDADVFSVMVLDTDEELFAWYQDGYTLLSPDAKLVIGHESPNYHVVVDGCRAPRCDGNYLAHSVSVRIERNVGLVPRAQRIYLNFAGGRNVSVGGLSPQDIGEFDASDLNPGWSATETAAIKTKIQERLQEVFDGYDVSVSMSRPTVPFQTIYFGGALSADGQLYGASAYIDVRNDTLAGAALVATEAIASAFPGYSVNDMGVAIGNVAGHHAGHLLGLRNTEGGAGDIMDPAWLAASLDSGTAEFTAAPLLRTEQYNYDAGLDSGQIGTQDAPQLFVEIIGTTD